eukprot:m.142292 g.142292  ORF g.142292 m.142292 type:complete len:443 (-) comp9644_c0_seq4:118-1446(-)
MSALPSARPFGQHAHHFHAALRDLLAHLTGRVVPAKRMALGLPLDVLAWRRVPPVQPGEHLEAGRALVQRHLAPRVVLGLQRGVVRDAVDFLHEALRRGRRGVPDQSGLLARQVVADIRRAPVQRDAARDEGVPDLLAHVVDGVAVLEHKAELVLAEEAQLVLGAHGLRAGVQARLQRHEARARGRLGVLNIAKLRHDALAVIVRHAVLVEEDHGVLLLRERHARWLKKRMDIHVVEGQIGHRNRRRHLIRHLDVILLARLRRQGETHIALEIQQHHELVGAGTVRVGVLADVRGIVEHKHLGIGHVRLVDRALARQRHARIRACLGGLARIPKVVERGASDAHRQHGALELLAHSIRHRDGGLAGIDRVVGREHKRIVSFGIRQDIARRTFRSSRACRRGHDLHHCNRLFLVDNHCRLLLGGGGGRCGRCGRRRCRNETPS